jgi:hypothetical protein
VRLRAAAWAAGFLLILLLARTSPGEIGRRLTALRHNARQEPAVRRANGTATAFDRAFFVFLESARRRMPPRTAGVAILGAAPADQAVYLASYHFAPLPVLLSPAAVPAGWAVAMYGPDRPDGWRVLAEVPGGAWLEPPR